MSACTKSSNDGDGGGTGGISARIVWQVSTSQSKTLSIQPTVAPAQVTTVRAIVSGSGISPDLQQDFNVALGAGSISGVPVGTGRTLVLQGLNSGGTPIFQGFQTGITVSANVTQDVGTVVPAQTEADVDAPNEITNLIVTPGDGQVVFTWSNPSNPDLAGIRIRRQTGQTPASPTDGDLVLGDLLVTTFTDTGVVNGTQYFYKIFTPAGEWSGSRVIRPRRFNSNPMAQTVIPTPPPPPPPAGAAWLSGLRW